MKYEILEFSNTEDAQEEIDDRVKDGWTIHSHSNSTYQEVEYVSYCSGDASEAVCGDKCLTITIIFQK